MVMTRIVAGRSLGIVAIALALSSPMGAQSGHELFQQALSKERAEGKLHEAIALYQRVIDVAGTDHALAAKALLQLGRCYEALGNTEARAVYERLIARYPEQTNHVAQSIRGYLGSPYGGHGLGRKTLHWRAAADSVRTHGSQYRSGLVS
jgi:tetratricopeptide (TPR) repeat protein